jgi:O-glycosyl hydrolase
MTQHNWSVANPLYIAELQKNAKAWKYFDIFATHGYVDGFKEDTRSESSQEFWNLIKDSGKTYWMTEGGTGDHEWPKPLTGVGAAIHNSLVAGNASAFVPWQITGEKATTHELMVRHEVGKKAQVVRHYSAYILPNSVRLGFDAGSSSVRASAYWHQEKKRLVIVLINPQKDEDTLDFSFAGLAPKSFQVYRTSGNEDMAELPAAAIVANALRVPVMGECVMTLVADGVPAK